MSRNLIRVLIMASAIAAVAVLVACGGSESPPETDSQESPTAGATPGSLQDSRNSGCGRSHSDFGSNQCARGGARCTGAGCDDQR